MPLTNFNFMRVMSASGYPRFHLHVKSKGNELEFSLHLDQKRPSYAGTSAHAGEYNGELVETETNRIKKLLEIN